MNTRNLAARAALALACFAWSIGSTAASPQVAATPAAVPDLLVEEVEFSLLARHGAAQRERIRRGLRQVAERWRPEDGDATDFHELATTQFAGTQEDLDALFHRFEHNLEMIFGHGLEVARELQTPLHVEDGNIQPYDEAFAAWSPTAHVLDELFANKLAFVALLNFPLTSLEERTRDGPGWTRRQWAETRLAETFRQRIPAAATRAVSEANAAAERYIAGYNLWMHHVLDARGQRLFPPGAEIVDIETKLAGEW